MKLADVRLKIVKKEPAQPLAVMSETLEKRGIVLGERQILLLIFHDFGKDAQIKDVQSYSSIEKVQGTKEIKGPDSFLAVWDNHMLNFQCPPKPAYLCTDFLSRIQNIPVLQQIDYLKKTNCHLWVDPNKT